MKAEIIECREATRLEKIISLGSWQFVTIWKLEDGRKIKVRTITKGGTWTYLQLEKENKTK
jgi:hypothetical protein